MATRESIVTEFDNPDEAQELNKAWDAVDPNKPIVASVKTGNESWISVKELKTEIDGQEVSDGFLVVMPNNYNISHQFSNRDYAKPDYNHPDIDKGQVAFHVTPATLAEDGKLSSARVDDLNFKVRNARAVAVHLHGERADFEKFLKGEKENEVFNPEKKEVRMTLKNPENGFSGGQIVKTGTYFVAQKTGEDDQHIYVRMLDTSRILNGSDEFRIKAQQEGDKVRSDYVAEKCPVGEHRKFSFSKDSNKVTVGSWTPTEQYKQAPKVDPATQDRQATQALQDRIARDSAKQPTPAPEAQPMDQAAVEKARNEFFAKGEAIAKQKDQAQPQADAQAQGEKTTPKRTRKQKV